MTFKTVIIHNIVTPYKTVLFNELYKKLSTMEVIYIAETESRRDWELDMASLRHPYSILFRGALEKQSKWKIFKHTWNKLKELDPDLLLVCDYSNIYGWASMLWGKINSKKMLFWFDSTWEDKKRNYTLEKLKTYFIKQFKWGIAPGIRTKEYFIRLGMDASTIVTTGYAVDNLFFQSEYEHYSHDRQNLIETIGAKKYSFLYVGRFAPEKNLLQLLKAFRDAHTINPDWGLILVGDGPSMSEIVEFIRENDIEEFVLLPGFIDHNEIAKFYTVSNIFILPSTSEPWGLVVNEAMNCELPIIVSEKCGCQPDLVDVGVNGYVINPSDLIGITDLLQQLMINANSLEKLGKQSAIIQNHSPKIVSDNIFHFLTTITDTPNS